MLLERENVQSRGSNDDLCAHEVGGPGQSQAILVEAPVLELTGVGVQVGLVELGQEFGQSR